MKIVTNQTGQTQLPDHNQMIQTVFPRLAWFRSGDLERHDIFSGPDQTLNSIGPAYLYTDRLFAVHNGELVYGRGNRKNIDGQGWLFTWKDYRLAEGFAIPGMLQTNWYHFLVEFLFCGWRLQQTNPDIPILATRVPRKGARRDIFERFRQQGYNLIEVDMQNRCRLVVEKLYSFNWPMYRLYYGDDENFGLFPHFCQYCRFLREEVSPASTDAPHRLVFSTRTANDRRIDPRQNELDSLFKIAGFEVVNFGEMSFEDQCRISKESVLMVGQHGANLANMLFMAPGTKVVEISNQSIPHSAGLYNRLAPIAGLKSKHISCEDFETGSLNLLEKQIEKIVASLNR